MSGRLAVKALSREKFADTISQEEQNGYFLLQLLFHFTYIASNASLRGHLYKVIDLINFSFYGTTIGNL